MFLCGEVSEVCHVARMLAFTLEMVTDFDRKRMRESSSPSSTTPRLRCLASLILSLQEAHVDFALSVIPEAVLYIRGLLPVDSGGQGHAGVDPTPRQSGQCGQEVHGSSPGLAGNLGLIHCSVMVVSRIFFQFRDLFPEDLTDQILNSILMLKTSACREVASIVKALVEMPQDCKYQPSIY
jgi:hypothetical protein